MFQKQVSFPGKSLDPHHVGSPYTKVAGSFVSRVPQNGPEKSLVPGPVWPSLVVLQHLLHGPEHFYSCCVGVFLRLELVGWFFWQPGVVVALSDPPAPHRPHSQLRFCSQCYRKPKPREGVLVILLGRSPSPVPGEVVLFHGAPEVPAMSLFSTLLRKLSWRGGPGGQQGPSLSVLGRSAALSPSRTQPQEAASLTVTTGYTNMTSI